MVAVRAYSQSRAGKLVQVGAHDRSGPEGDDTEEVGRPAEDALGPYADVRRRQDCELQALIDEQRCRMLAVPAVRSRCFESANARYGACTRGRVLPPLILQ